MSELVTIPNIQLIATGEWLASTGKVTFTAEDLRNIMASQGAPDVKEPRMILGHTPGAEPPGMSAVADEGFFGEQPAIGKFTNLALSADGQEITADLVGVPKWLADILPTAYANRSVEVYWDVPSGILGAPNHAAVMPRVALLGHNLPAVATLDDLKVLFSEEGPAEVEFDDATEAEPELAKASKRIAAHKEVAMPNRVAASVQFEDVRREFYNSFATEASGRYWWYITAVYVDPPTLIVDDDDESLWSVPYTVKGDAVEFGEPVKIKVQYVEEESGKVAASAPASGAVGRQYTKAASRPSDRTRTKEKAEMGIDIPALRERTGLTVEQLPDDASEEQINAALSAPAPEAPAGGDGEAETETAPEGGETETQQPATTAASAGDDGTVRVDRAAWEAMQASHAELRTDLEGRVKASREGVVQDAIKAGKIPPSRKDHYMKLMTADPDGTVELLNSLEATIPVEQRETGVADPGGSTQAAMSDYDMSWLSDAERQRVEAQRAGTPTAPPRVVSEA